jgi:hypothetical protein
MLQHLGVHRRGSVACQRPLASVVAVLALARSPSTTT